MKRIILFSFVLSWVFLSAFQLDNFHFPNASEPLYIPTYIEDNDESCHPDVHYFPSGFSGWNYWMCHTPYPNSVAQYENPSIVVSNDGLVWQEPEGIQNPVADVYTGTDHNNNYNSDNHIVMSPDGETMHLIWRRKNGWNNELIQMKSSTDGINWGETSTLLSVWGTDPVLNETALSPCVLHNGTGYLMWTVNTKVNPRSVYLRFSRELDFSNSEPVLTDIGEFAEGYRLWHMDIDFIDGYYHCLASVGNPATQEGRVLYLGKSLNGINWEFGSQPVMSGTQGNWDARLYRSAFLKALSGEGYRTWYGSMNHPQWRIGYSETTVENYLPQVSHFAAEALENDQYRLNFNHQDFPVAGYKLYLNHEFYTEIDGSETEYTLSLSENAIFEDSRVFSIKYFLDDGRQSDPSVIRIETEVSNPQSPLLPQSLRVYPNPFLRQINIENKAALCGQIGLYNLKGQLLLEKPLYKELQLELPENLATGLYFLRFTAPGEIAQTIKLLKLK